MASEPTVGKHGEGSVLKGSFAIALTWPAIKNAEYEVVQRIFTAGKNIGVGVQITDNDGYPLWSSEGIEMMPKRRIDSEQCDFIIALHFESPRLYDAYSYIALWNPPEFLSVFGYSRSIEKMTSHSDVLSCDSVVADSHARNSFRGVSRPFMEPPQLFFHSLPQPYFQPTISTNSRLFYVGINWERISGEKGRHHDLLKILDDENLIQIYGPKTFQGVEPWRGFKNYCGSIPFDGVSAVREINKAGICLALSSKAHQRSGIMSTRLFEGMAAGAVIIANPHPFITKHFSDCVYVIDETVSPKELAEEIRALILDIRKNPDQAMRRAKLGQQRLLDGNFGLESNLTALFDAHIDRRAASNAKRLGYNRHGVGVIFVFPGLSIDNFRVSFANIARQTMVHIDLFLVCDQGFHDRYRQNIEDHCRASDVRLVVEAAALFSKEERPNEAPLRMIGTGPSFAKALSRVTTPYFCILQSDDHWMSDHLASLAQVLSQSYSTFACSGRLIEISGDDAPLRHFDALVFERFGDLLEVSYERDVGRFMYRTELTKKLPLDVLSLLDGQEHQLINLWAQIGGFPAQSAFASYVYLENSAHVWVPPLIPTSQQTEYIRDSVRGSADWMQMRSMAPPKAGIRDRGITFNHMYSLCLHGDGQTFMASGFSVPEATYTWVDGRAASMLVELRMETVDLKLHVTMAGRTTLKMPCETCSVFANNVLIGNVLLTDQIVLHRFDIPASILRATTIRFMFQIPRAQQVIGEDGKLIDPRYLSMLIGQMGLFVPKNEKQTKLTPYKRFRRIVGETLRFLGLR